MSPARMHTARRPESSQSKIFCFRLVVFVLACALVLGGCAKRERRSTAISSKPAQGSLSSLYTRLPDQAARDRARQQAGYGIGTPQSELSLAVCQTQALRLQSEFQRSALKFGAPIYIRIFKESHELELWVQRGERFYLFKKYPIAYFSGGLGPKLHEGDLQAPEGFYDVLPSRMNPWSNFHLAFNIGYPNLYDQARQASGGMIMVHGKKLSVGCFAMTDPVIEEIYAIADRALNAGQPYFQVHIFPFRMTPANLQRHGNSPHIAFWRNLLRGYTLFELTHVPPQVSVQQSQYAFSSGHTSPVSTPVAAQASLPRAPRANMVSIERELQVLP